MHKLCKHNTLFFCQTCYYSLYYDFRDIFIFTEKIMKINRYKLFTSLLILLFFVIFTNSSFSQSEVDWSWSIVWWSWLWMSWSTLDSSIIDESISGVMIDNSLWVETWTDNSIEIFTGVDWNNTAIDQTDLPPTDSWQILDLSQENKNKKEDKTKEKTKEKEALKKEDIINEVNRNSLEIIDSSLWDKSLLSHGNKASIYFNKNKNTKEKYLQKRINSWSTINILINTNQIYEDGQIFVIGQKNKGSLTLTYDMSEQRVLFSIDNMDEYPTMWIDGIETTLLPLDGEKHSIIVSFTEKYTSQIEFIWDSLSEVTLYSWILNSFRQFEMICEPYIQRDIIQLDMPCDIDRGRLEIEAWLFENESLIETKEITAEEILDSIETWDIIWSWDVIDIIEDTMDIQTGNIIETPDNPFTWDIVEETIIIQTWNIVWSWDVDNPLSWNITEETTITETWNIVWSWTVDNAPSTGQMSPIEPIVE